MSESYSKGKDQQDATQFITQSGVLDVTDGTDEDLVICCTPLSDDIIAFHTWQEKLLQLVNLFQEPKSKYPSASSISAVRSFCLSDDGKWLAVYSKEDALIKIWLVESLLKNLRNFTGAKAQVFPVKKPDFTYDSAMGSETQLGIHFIGENNSHIMISFAAMHGLRQLIIDVTSGKKVGDIELWDCDACVPYGPNKFLTISHVVHAMHDGRRDLRVHAFEFTPDGSFLADIKGKELLSAEKCNFSSIAVSKDLQQIAVLCKDSSGDTHPYSTYVQRYTIQEDEKSDSGYHLTLTGKFPSARFPQHYFTRGNELVFRRYIAEQDQIGLFAVASDSKDPTKVANDCEISCALPNGNIMGLAESGIFNIHAMAGDILRQALARIVHQVEVVRLPGQFSKPIGGIVADYSVELKDMRLFSRPKKQILDYKDPEKNIVEHELKQSLTHPLISGIDKMSIQEFLRHSDNLKKGVDAALNYPGISANMRDFWEDLGVVFGQSKKAAPS